MFIRSLRGTWSVTSQINNWYYVILMCPNLVIPKKKKKIQKKIFFFIIFTKIFTTQKIRKMENKHPEHFWFA